MSGSNATPPVGFKFKMGKTPCEISYVTGTAVSPNESTLKTTTTTISRKGSETSTETYVSTTQLQDFHLLKDDGREIGVYTRDAALNVREGHCLTLIRGKATTSGKEKYFNMGFVNHHTDETIMLHGAWGEIYRAPKSIGIAILIASVYIFDLYLQGDFFFSMLFGIPTGIVVAAGVYIYGIYKPASNKWEKRLFQFMREIRDYGNAKEFHKRA